MKGYGIISAPEVPRRNSLSRPAFEANFQVLALICLCAVLCIEIATQDGPTTASHRIYAHLKDSFDSLRHPWSPQDTYPFPLTDPYLGDGFISYDPKQPFDTRWVPLTRLNTGVTPPGLPSSDTLPLAEDSPPDWIRLAQLACNLSYPPVKDASQPGFDVPVLLPGHILDPNPRYPLLELASTPEDQIKLRAKAVEQTKHLRNFTILSLGDSTDRNSIGQAAWSFQTMSTAGGYANAPVNITDHGRPQTVLVDPEGLNLRFVNGFFYGALDDVDYYSYMADWYAPGDALDRIEQLFKPHADALDQPVKLISVNAGLWDLVYPIDTNVGGWNTTPDVFPIEQLEKLATRMRLILRKVRATWPGVPVVYRTVQRAGPAARSDARTAQMQILQRAIAREAGVALLDFGRIFEGNQRYQDEGQIHPNQYPGGHILIQALLHQAYLSSYLPDYNTAMH